MKLLVLAQQVGGDAPGILYERLLSALTERCEVDLVCCAYMPARHLELHSLQTFRYPRMKHWMKQAMTVLQHGDWFSRRFAQEIRIAPNVDLILSLCSNGHFFALEAGGHCRKKSGKPFAAYFVDAIPSPLNWTPNGLYRRSVVSLVKRCCKHLSYFATLCPEMLAYQRQYLPERLWTECFLPPVSGSEIRSVPMPSGHPRFLYAGRIYGRRSARALLEGFAQLEGEAELVFVGKDEDRIRREIEKYAPECAGRVRFKPWTKNVFPYIAEATALIDIDADLPEDVYLSSKLFTYLKWARPVISITGGKSPARRLMTGLDSVLVCAHDAGEIKAAMEKCISGLEGFDYSDRSSILEAASAVRTAERFLQIIPQL